jgi:hypothetical protein
VGKGAEEFICDAILRNLLSQVPEDGSKHRSLSTREHRIERRKE